jgi:hypothetical protein
MMIIIYISIYSILYHKLEIYYLHFNSNYFQVLSPNPHYVLDCKQISEAPASKGSICDIGGLA